MHGLGEQDSDLQKVIQASIIDTGMHNPNIEPIPKLEKRIRETNMPTGLRNVGNTCYFNSLLQQYYAVPHFVTKILSFKVDEKLLQDGQGLSQDNNGVNN